MQTLQNDQFGPSSQGLAGGPIHPSGEAMLQCEAVAAGGMAGGATAPAPIRIERRVRGAAGGATGAGKSSPIAAGGATSGADGGAAAAALVRVERRATVGGAAGGARRAISDAAHQLGDVQPCRHGAHRMW